MKKTRSRLSLLVAAFCSAACGCAAPHAAAQSAYPSRNVQIIVPYTAGGSIDIMTRAVAQRLAEMWGRNVVVDNRPGASGMIGTEIVTKADPDGHTLLGHTSSYPATAAVREKLPFDPARAIVPVAMIARAPMLLAVHPSVPAKTVKELVALAKKNPGKLNYSSSGDRRQQSFLRRAVRFRGGRQAHARSVQGHCAGGHRARLRRSRDRDRERGRGQSAAEGRPGARACRQQRRALAAAAGPAVDRAVRRARLQLRAVVGNIRPGGHARRPDQHRSIPRSTRSSPAPT